MNCVLALLPIPVSPWPAISFRLQRFDVPLGRHSAGNGLVQTAAYTTSGNKCPYGGPRINRGRIFCTEHGARRSRNLHRRQTAGIVRDMRRNDTVHAECRVRLGVTNRAVDRVRRHTRSAGEIDMDRIVRNRHPANDIDRSSSNHRHASSEVQSPSAAFWIASIIARRLR